MRQCSKHLSHIEARLMENGYLGHEVVRQLMQIIEGFCPPPFGDWGFMMRKAQDIAVRTLRELVKVYDKGFEGTESFMVRAVHLMRLYVEEAFHRCLLSCEGSVRKSALCSLMVTMRHFEADTLPEVSQSLGIFTTLTEENVRSIAMKVSLFEDTSIEMLPSYGEVMKSADLKVEAFSLKLLRTSSASIVMSKEEVKVLIEANGCTVPEDAELPGLEVPSAFAPIFSGEDQRMRT